MASLRLNLFSLPSFEGEGFRCCLGFDMGLCLAAQRTPEFGVWDLRWRRARQTSRLAHSVTHLSLQQRGR